GGDGLLGVFPGAGAVVVDGDGAGAVPGQVGGDQAAQVLGAASDQDDLAFDGMICHGVIRFGWKGGSRGPPRAAWTLIGRCAWRRPDITGAAPPAKPRRRGGARCREDTSRAWSRAALRCMRWHALPASSRPGGFA